LVKGGGKPLEALSNADARAVLVGAQAGAKLPPADVSEKTITVDGKRLAVAVDRLAAGGRPEFRHASRKALGAIDH
jgi:acetyl esterase